MSTRYFCDGCGKDVTTEPNRVYDQLENGKGGVMVRVSAGFNAMGEGHVCTDCVIDAVYSLDRRAQPAVREA